MLLLLFIRFTQKKKGSTMACHDLRNFWNFRVMIYGKKFTRILKNTKLREN